MTRLPRAVVTVATSGSHARLTVVANGAPYTVDDLLDLARAAGLEPRRARGVVLVPLRRLPDVEAMAKVRRVILQRKKGATTEAASPFQPPARIGVDVEPVHGCARGACRVPGCRYERNAS